MDPKIKTSGASEPHRKEAYSLTSLAVVRRRGLGSPGAGGRCCRSGGVLVVAAALSYPHLISSLVASDSSVTGSDSQI